MFEVVLEKFGLSKPEEEPKPQEVMAWEGSHLTLGQAIETLDAVVRHAAGKPATDEVLAKVPLPPGITVQDARDCIFWAGQMKRARKADRALERAEAAVALQTALTVRARLKIAGKRLLGKRAKSGSNRAKLQQQQSRKRNRRK